jgi:uroporphyrinogen-III decarboxylase
MADCPFGNPAGAPWRSQIPRRLGGVCFSLSSDLQNAGVHLQGNIRAIYPDLVELGIAAVNSQLFVMDIEELGRTFGGKIAFWGEIDRQFVLPFGTEQDARKAVGRMRRALDGGTGGVFAQCEWGVNVPPETIKAVIRAWMEPIENLP